MWLELQVGSGTWRSLTSGLVEEHAGGYTGWPQWSHTPRSEVGRKGGW